MLDNETFWVAVGAVSTAVSVTVALLLPFYLGRLNEEKARILVARELHENMKTIRQIAEVGNKSSIMFAMGVNQLEEIQEYRKHLSLNHWAHFKFQMKPDHYICFEQLVLKIEHIKSLSGPPGSLIHNSVKAAKSLVHEYEIISERCRYFRI